MKTTLKALVLAVVVAGLPLGMTQANDNKHEGIEITVNINTANAEELDKLLLGVGPEKAVSIIEYRDTHGQFESIEQLSEVKGIGPATVDKNRDRIQL